jgi:tetratricopeptide (TPR) repeat protein
MEQAALAAEHIQRSAELAPRNRFVLGQVAVGLMQCGKLEQAVPHLKAALELGSDVAVRLDLANVLQVTDQPLEAMRQYRLVLKERPEWPLAMNNLAWLLATSPRDDVRSPTEALSLAERACRLSDNKEPVWLDTLAAAYAATGQYPKAVETIQQAIRLAQPAGPGSPNAKLGVWDPPQKVQELQSRMELYKAGKAFIDAPDAATQEAADKK